MSILQTWLSHHKNIIKNYQYYDCSAVVVLAQILDLYRLYNHRKLITNEISLTNTNEYQNIVATVDFDFSIAQEHQLQITTDVQTITELENSYLYKIKLQYVVTSDEELHKLQEQVRTKLNLQNELTAFYSLVSE